MGLRRSADGGWGGGGTLAEESAGAGIGLCMGIVGLDSATAGGSSPSCISNNMSGRIVILASR